MKKLFLFLLFISYCSIFNCHYCSAQKANKEITFEDIWVNHTFQPKSFSGIMSMKDGEHYTLLENEKINEYSYKTGEKTATIVSLDELIPEGTNKSISVDNYEFSPDETKILFTTETKSIYRHSTTATFYIWDINKKKLTALSNKKEQRLASFSPMSDKIAFVYENNLYIKDIVNGTEQQITNDGKSNSIINGATDWVYEEELDLIKAFEWSPDGQKIAFYRFDESNVREFEFPVYGDLYPEIYKYKYPKPGEANSVIKIYVYFLKNNTYKTVDIGSDTDIYIPRIIWTQDANILSVLRLNRLQNKFEILLADVNTGAAKVMYTEENKYYLDVPDITFLKDNKQFIITSERDGYKHIYLFNMQGKLVNPVTKGSWDVDAIKSIDEKNKIVYYTSSESSPLDRDLYSVKFDGTDKKKLSTLKGTNDADFSDGCKYYISYFSDVNTPPVITINTANGRQLRVSEDNSQLIEKIKEYNFQKFEFFTFKTSEGVELNGGMLKPADFNPAKKYPVLMYVYGGPGSQTVLNRWGGGDLYWYQMLAQKGYIIVSVDNRGTGARGEAFKKCTYLQLGNLESDDQGEAAKYLGSLPYVDKDRIGIWGWSYGGYMTALCMTKEADYFKAGIAVAPVTNWRFYDNIYTERFMRTPKENPDGYDNNSPIKYAGNLKGKFLMIHGTADDNVHFQNSAELVLALLKENKQFDTFYYPNKNHFIRGGTTRLNLYTKITEYILKNL